MENCFAMYFIYSLFLIFNFLVRWAAAEEHTIYWNVSNVDFRFPDESSNSITVSMDDTLRVVCPADGVEKRYLKIHKVSALSYESCLLETQKTLVVTCDGSEASKKPTIIGVRRLSPLPSSESILFEPGETYYWIATSSGEKEGINQAHYGMCAADNMRLVIHVRAQSDTSSTEVRTTTVKSVRQELAHIPSETPVNPRFSAIAHSLATYPQRREPKIPDGVTPEQLEKVAALAQKGATGTFTFGTASAQDHERDSGSRAESIFWDTAPLLENVLSGASDDLLLGSNRIGDEEGAFVVHEDIARSYEYQSNVCRTPPVTLMAYVALLVFTYRVIL
uniref:Ephrin RBD domain-containing protein n=2 Tax=Haemonchus contortus TaxID=6289 RepID=A0A7I4YKS7_HAECO